MPGRGKRLVEMTGWELWLWLIVTLTFSVGIFFFADLGDSGHRWFMRSICVFFWLGDAVAVHELWARSRRSKRSTRSA